MEILIHLFVLSKIDTSFRKHRTLIQLKVIIMSGLFHTPALVDMALDLQIEICAYLHPYDILTLRKTCKTFQVSTRQRIIWIEALRRVCLENKLFLPTFPIPDMSNVELEQAAIAPRRWIELSTSLATSPSEVKLLSPKVTRKIYNPFSDEEGKGSNANLILVPGGRYLVGCWPTDGFGVWDLGYLSSAHCKLIASAKTHGESYAVNPTPDGMGLVIFSCCPELNGHFYEIYPQNETPQLTQIAHCDFHHAPWEPDYISSDKLFWYIQDSYNSRIILAVWDYRLKASVSFSTKFDPKEISYTFEICATHTAIVALFQEEIWIWAIPLLTLQPQPLDFKDIMINPQVQLAPQVRVKVPVDPEHLRWKVMSTWYIDSSRPIYFDRQVMQAQQIHRFKIIIKPDLSDATLHFINTLPFDCPDSQTSASVVCEDTLVSCWNDLDSVGHRTIHTGSRVSSPADNILHGDVKISLPAGVSRQIASPICPASGRFVHSDGSYHENIVVLDFLQDQEPDSDPESDNELHHCWTQ